MNFIAKIRQKSCKLASGASLTVIFAGIWLGSIPEYEVLQAERQIGCEGFSCLNINSSKAINVEFSGEFYSQAHAQSASRHKTEAVVTLWVSDAAISANMGSSDSSARADKNRPKTKGEVGADEDESEKDRARARAARELNEKFDKAKSPAEREKLAHISEMAATRLRARLKAARVKDATVTTDGGRAIVVRARGKISREALAGIVVPQGEFAIRPVLHFGERWMEVLDELPDGVKLRQGDESLDAKNAYLWSSDIAQLKTALKRVGPKITADGGVELMIYPSNGGWRSLALGIAAATHDDVGQAHISQGQTGEDFVRLEFKHDLSARTRNQSISAHSQLWALVLDGEVVSVFARSGDGLGKSLSTAAPNEIKNPAQRRLWAQQVAGRLAAFMPVELVEAGEPGESN